MFVIANMFSLLFCTIGFTQSWHMTIEETPSLITERSGLVLQGPNRERFNLIFPGKDKLALSKGKYIKKNFF